MAVKNTIVNFSYGIGDNLIQIPPVPIIARRDPTSSDIAQLGTLWINNPTDTAWLLTSVVAGVASWTPAPVAGSTTVASLVVTGPAGITVDTGDVDITLGDLNLAAGSATIAGDLTVNGTTTINGDFDLTSAALIDLTSTLNAAPSILLHANGGAAESIELHSDQGTSVTSVNIHSDVGGLTLASGLASADAINIAASSGGVDIDGALQVNIASSQNAADSIVITSSVGGIDILAAGAGAGEDIDIIATGSSVNINSTENAADSIVISSTNGGIDISALGASAGEDIDITATGSSVNVVSTENAAQAIYLHANGGTSETIQIHADQGTGVASLNILSDVGGITLSAGLATADAINITASNAAGGIDIDAGTAGFIVDTTGAISLDAAAASNFTATGAFDVTVSSTAGSIVVSGGEAVADAIQLTAGNAAGGVTLASGTGGFTVNSTNGIVALNSGTAAINVGTDAVAHTVTIGNATGASSVVVNVGTGALNLGTTATAHATAVGSTTAGSTLTLNTPTGVNTVAANGLSVTTAGRGLSLPGGVLVLAGAGSPDTVVTAPAGSLFLRTDPAGATSRAYINTDSATAWTNITCAA